MGQASNAVLDSSTIASTPSPSSASSCATPPPYRVPDDGVPLDAERAESSRTYPAWATSPSGGRAGRPSRPSPAGRERSRGTATRAAARGPARRTTTAGTRGAGRRRGPSPSSVYATRAAGGRARALRGSDRLIAAARAIASTTRTTRVISFTSCTRTMSTPSAAHHATAPAVPSTRSSTSAPVSVPMNRLRLRRRRAPGRAR